MSAILSRPQCVIYICEFGPGCGVRAGNIVLIAIHLILNGQFHQPRLVIRTFHHQERCSRGGHLCNEHSEEKYSCSYK